jgi:hypothetical protein
MFGYTQLHLSFVYYFMLSFITVQYFKTNIHLYEYLYICMSNIYI